MYQKEVFLGLIAMHLRAYTQGVRARGNREVEQELHEKSNTTILVLHALSKERCTPALAGSVEKEKGLESMPSSVGNETRNGADVQMGLELKFPTLSEIEFYDVLDIVNDIIGKKEYISGDMPPDDVAPTAMSNLSDTPLPRPKEFLLTDTNMTDIIP